jgi:hypothetical protein
VAAILASLLAVGCKGNGWTRCGDGSHLRIWVEDVEHKADHLAFEGARYRVIKTEPLTVEYEGLKAKLPTERARIPIRERTPKTSRSGAERN